MIYVYGIILILLSLVWLGLVPFSMPGNWLMVISAAFFAWLTKEHHVFSTYTIVFITGIAFLGEIIEFLAGVGGARKAGAGFFTSLGAIIGAIAGAILGTILIPIPIVGTVIGSCVGAGLGTWTLESLAGKPHHQSLKSGFGASMGQLIGLSTKFAIGVVIFLTIAFAVFIP